MFSAKCLDCQVQVRCIRKANREVENMKEKILTMFFLILLTGLPHTIRYYGLLVKVQPYVNVGVALIFFAGCFGLYNMYKSVRFKDKQKRIAVLFTGFLLVLIAFFVLELLFMGYGKI